MSNRTGAISIRRRITFIALIVACIIAAIFGRKVFQAHLSPDRTVAAPAPPGFLEWIVLGAVGMAMVVAAFAVYGIVLLTGCFTFDHGRPFVKAFGRRVVLAHFVTAGLLSNGSSLIVAPFFTAILWILIPGTLAIELGWLVPGLVSIFYFWLFLWIWAPLDLMVINRRMSALGVPPDRIAAGLPIGTSDPDRKRRRWFAGTVEEDMGMLWFDADQLTYFGDSGPWAITRDQLLSIDRLAHKRALASHFGVIHVVLRYRRPDGSEGRVLLFTEGNWTQFRQARALDKLADRLISWREGASPQPLPLGFEVIGAHETPDKGAVETC